MNYKVQIEWALMNLNPPKHLQNAMCTQPSNQTTLYQTTPKNKDWVLKF